MQQSQHLHVMNFLHLPHEAYLCTQVMLLSCTLQLMLFVSNYLQATISKAVMHVTGTGCLFAWVHQCHMQDCLLALMAETYV